MCEVSKNTARKLFVVIVLSVCDAQRNSQFPTNYNYPDQTFQTDDRTQNSNKNYGQPGVAYRVNDGRDTQNLPSQSGRDLNVNYLGVDQRDYNQPNVPPYSVEPDQNARNFGSGRTNIEVNDPQNPGRRQFDDDFVRRNKFNGDIRRLLQGLDVQASQQCTANVAAQWNFETNINEATQLEAVSKYEKVGYIFRLFYRSVERFQKV